MIAKATKIETVRLNRICVDGGTQARASLSEEVIAEYAELIQTGTELPPIVVFHDGERHWLADGFHRYHAAKRIKLPHLECEVREGGQRDAILFAVGSNVTHGLRRTNEDKHRAIMMLLGDDEWVERSDHWIANACVVGARSVGRVRAQYKEFQRPRTLGLDGKVRKTARAQSCGRSKVRNAKATVTNDDEPHRPDLLACNFKRATARDLAETLAEVVAKHPQPIAVFAALQAALVARGILAREKRA